MNAPVPRSPLLRHVPNLITAARGIAGPTVAALLLIWPHPVIAFWLFAVAALTDLFDGWLARRWTGPNPIGHWLDATADKFLIGFTWLGLWCVGWAPWWLALPSIGREIIIGVIWIRSATHGFRFAPNAWGQVMVSFEGTAVGILLFHGPWNGVHWPSVGVTLGVISMALSFVAIIDYIARRPHHPSSKNAAIA